MELSNPSELIRSSDQRLAQAPQARKIVLIYAGISLILALVFTLADYLLGLGVSRTGGLANMGSRAILSAVQTVLPFIHTGIAMCVDLGYLSAALRIARGQYASAQSLRLGFDRFWPLLRLTVILGLIYLGIGTVSVYVSSMLFVMTPLSSSFMSLLTPLLSQASAADPTVLLDEAAYGQLVSAMTPVFVISILIFCLAAAPVFYRYRMADYLLIDHPGMGALAILRESRQMMQGNRRKLLKLDLRLWWYYALVLLTTGLAYGDMLLPLMGISLPWSDTFSYYLFYGLYLGAQFALTLCLRNRVQTTYALAYDSLCPRQTQSQGVVLGNIFQM